METKDWILLLVPILFNGVILTFWSRRFEKKKMVLNEKYKYVDVLRDKLDAVLDLSIYDEGMSQKERFILMENILSRWSIAYSYYLQRSCVLRRIGSVMEKCNVYYTRISNILVLNPESEESDLSQQLALLLEGIKKAHSSCIEYKV